MDRIAIHGFGRIGRSTLKAALTGRHFVPACLSDVKDVATLAALFEVDSNYGRWQEDVMASQDSFTIGGREIKYFNASESLPDWAALDIDVVIDCTGRATVRAGAQAH
jgi:glyceraldehyde 3-phosphate dehydrogenase